MERFQGFRTLRPAIAVNVDDNRHEVVIAIARNATRNFETDLVVQKQFGYEHVLSQLNAPKKEETPPAKW